MMQFKLKVRSTLQTYCAGPAGKYPAPADLLTLGPVICRLKALRRRKPFLPKDLPARTTCGVQLSAGMKIEIECIALAG